jgi:entericidin B
MLKKLTAILLVAGFAGMAGCNTMSGVGKDVQKGGEKIENSAEKHK